MVIKGLSSILSCVAIALCGCAHRESASVSTEKPLLRNLGSHSFPVTTRSSAAQQAFDRGLNWAYGFGHFAAEQEFRRAAAEDPQCAMAYWGIALVNGPHINFPMVPAAKAKTAWDALQKAVALSPGASRLEQALITALSKRYANPQPEDRSGLDKAYAEAMKKVWGEFPERSDVGTLYAEAAMDLHPWDLWVNGTPQPWTPEIVSTLERVLVLNPKHPGANHLYIHAMEASSEPFKAEVAADRLGRMVPDSSHLIHMPSHIYVRVGRWEDATDSNARAMKADRRYRKAYPRPGFYGMYMAHNSHFMAFTAMMRGRSEEALRVARETVAGIPQDFLEEHAAVADGFMVFPAEVLMRFGRWEEILQEPAPATGLPLAKAKWHFLRASALTNLDRPEEARRERELFLQAKEGIPQEAFFGNNSSRELMSIAEDVLDGEMAARHGDLETAINKLEQASRKEDKIRYDEPPDWIQPVRHTLGAVLLRAGRPSEAEKKYREDLTIFPENGWSLMGLRDALQAQGKNAEANEVASRFKRQWSTADVKPSATCYCQEGLLASH